MIEPIMEADRLLLYGMLDRAEALYRGVAEEDPTNAFAWLGLARVASERTDDVAAYGFAARAAQADPGNGHAVALTQRLADILAARGVALPTSEPPGRLRRILRR